MSHHRLHHLVESLVRAGADERTIVAAVAEGASNPPPAPRVLVADDEPLTRLDVAALLTDAGFDVCAEAADGLQAVALALQHEPDAIVMDANMPRLDGLAAVQKIHAVRRVPIVLLTGYRYGELVDRAHEVGVSSYVVKPFAEGEVVEAVLAALAA
jgi:two-component system, response regulator PdtaR